MYRTISRQLKVLINHVINYIVSLCHLCKLSHCWIGTSINIRSVIKWWLRFDVIDGSWFFSAWNLYHSCHTTNSFYRRMMHEEDVRPPHMLIMSFLLTDPSCNSCSPQLPIERMASVNMWLHLPKILFSSLHLKLFDIAHTMSTYRCET